MEIYEKNSVYFLDFDWERVAKEDNLQEAFITKWKDKLNWRLISIYQKLSEGFIEEHQDLVIWSEIYKNQKLSPEFIFKHIDKFQKVKQ